MLKLITKNSPETKAGAKETISASANIFSATGNGTAKPANNAKNAVVTKIMPINFGKLRGSKANGSAKTLRLSVCHNL